MYVWRCARGCRRCARGCRSGCWFLDLFPTGCTAAATSDAAIIFTEEIAWMTCQYINHIAYNADEVGRPLESLGRASSQGPCLTACTRITSSKPLIMLLVSTSKLEKTKNRELAHLVSLQNEQNKWAHKHDHHDSSNQQHAGQRVQLR